MIETKDILGIAAVTIITFLIIKFILKWINELRVKRKINKKPVYKKLSIEEINKEQEKFQRQIIHDLNKYYSNLFDGKSFINKSTTSLNEFIINDNLNHYDLHKLAHLNKIKLQMHSGWNDLVLNLIQELDAAGWDKKVGTIKEKFGELRFYSDTEHHDLINKYTEKSKTICEICGQTGEFYTISTWDFTRCKKHKNS